MLPSPQTSEDVLAPTPFQPGGAEIPTIRANAIWRNSQRHRGGGVLARATWIVLGGQRLVVGCLVFALLALPSFLLRMTARRAKSHIHL
jgi:hypothetical protein